MCFGQFCSNLNFLHHCYFSFLPYITWRHTYWGVETVCGLFTLFFFIFNVICDNWIFLINEVVFVSIGHKSTTVSLYIYGIPQCLFSRYMETTSVCVCGNIPPSLPFITPWWFIIFTHVAPRGTKLLSAGRHFRLSPRCSLSLSNEPVKWRAHVWKNTSRTN